MNKKKITPALLSGMMTISMGTTPISVLAQEEQPQEINETNVEQVNEPVSTEETETVLNTDNDSQNTSLEQQNKVEESNENSNTKTTTSTETNKEIVQEDAVIPLADSVASVTIDGVTTSYDTLDAAIIAVEGKTATITILQDCSFSASLMEISSGNITINGEGKTITGDGSISGINSIVSTNLTINNVNFNGVRLNAINGGTINFNSGSIGELNSYNISTVNIYSGYIQELNAINEGTVNIHGGNIGFLNSLLYSSINYIPDSITFEESTVSIPKGSNYQFENPVKQNTIIVGGNNITISPAWTSSNPNIVSVDSQGYLTAKGIGTATITASAGEKKATCEVTVTKKDGNELVTTPTGLTGLVMQRLYEIELPTGWQWDIDNKGLSLGENHYDAIFSTRDYEDEYDFTNVEGYNSNSHYVKRTVTITATRRPTTLTITTNMDKVYDANPVSEPNVDKLGSLNDVEFKWFEKNGSYWQELSSAPTVAGHYKVIASVAEDNVYAGATAEKEFSISQTTNEWTEELSITGWTHGEQANEPTAKAKFGTVTFSYSDKEDGTYTDTMPTDAETWYVKATVIGNENYTGLETIKEFAISKADSSIAFKDGFSLHKTYDTKAVSVNADNVETTGSKGYISFSYEKKVDDTWETLSEAPTGAGTYRVTATLDGDNNYNSATSQPLEFTIGKAQIKVGFNQSNIDKEYDGKEVFVGTYQQGGSQAATKTWYQKMDDGTWKELTNTPKNAGSYKVVLKAEGNENYIGAQTEMTFEITKAVPTYTLPSDLIIKQGETLSSVILPEGFTWKDGTQKADTLGTQMFKATYTPSDTTNYQTVDVDITIDIVPATIPVNQPPVINAKDQTLTVGDKFDPMKGVTATDKEDGDLTDKIVIAKNTVDTSKAGKYTIDYEVTDNGGTRVRKTIVVTVKEKAATSDDGNKSDTDKKTTSKDTAQTSTQTNVLAWTLLGLASAGAFITGLFKRKHQ